jgi:DNA excision repair protein ERCC-4
MSGRVHQIAVDHSESRSALLDALRRSGVFEVRMVHLTTGDYLLNDRALVERKSVADFATSLIDGRLFPQVARLAHSGVGPALASRLLRLRIHRRHRRRGCSRPG